MSIALLKLQKFNTERLRNQEQVGNVLGKLNDSALLALKQQAYMHLNPDANGADELIAESTPTFLILAEKFNEIAAMLEDSQKVSAGTMTASDLVTKYALDMTEFSDSLIK